MSQSIAYPNMGLIYKINADNKAAAIAYSKGKMDANEYQAVLDQNAATFYQSEQAASQNQRTAENDWTKLSKILGDYADREQRQEALRSQQMPQTTHCSQGFGLNGGINCTTW